MIRNLIRLTTPLAIAACLVAGCAGDDDETVAAAADDSPGVETPDTPASADLEATNGIRIGDAAASTGSTDGWFNADGSLNEEVVPELVPICAVAVQCEVVDGFVRSSDMFAPEPPTSPDDAAAAAEQGLTVYDEHFNVIGTWDGQRITPVAGQPGD